MQHDQAVRYARHIALPEIGESGQQKLLSARVAVIGAGGLGSPLLFYLAAAGVGTIGIIDHDRVALSNLHRQIIHETADIDRLKTDSARDTLLDLNPGLSITTHPLRLDESNIDTLLSDYDLIADGSDNFETRFLINRYCHHHHKTLVSAAILGFTGQLYTFKSYLGDPHPCYQCLCPELPPADATPRCAEAGILGSLGGIMGAWQASEIIKEIVGIGESLSGSMVAIDVLKAQIRKVKILRNSLCICCR